MFISHLLTDEPALAIAITWALISGTGEFYFGASEEKIRAALTAAATGTLFARFAASLRRDFEAISAALVLP